MNLKVASFALTCLLCLSATAVAQPPNISRWTGATAVVVQPQGYSQGSPLTLTWGFMAPNTQIFDNGEPAGFNNLQTFLNGIYGSQAVWQPHFQSVFNRWSSISGLTYQFESADDGSGILGNVFPTGVLGVRADIRIGGKAIDGPFNVLAYNYFPNIGDMVIDTSDTFFNDTSNNSLGLRNVIAHEHGHGLGMSHLESSNSNQLMEPFLDLAFDGPQYHDILLAHRGYGDVLEKSNAGLGNDTSVNATALGLIPTATAISIGNDARNLVVANTEIDFVSIDDDTDIDVFSFSVASAGSVNVLLESLGLTYNATPQGAGGGTPFNSELRSDLTLALLGTDGSTILQSANLTGLGGDEMINFLLGSAGTYFLRITGVDNVDAIALDTQFYGLTVGFTQAVPEPGTIGLFAVLSIAGFVVARRRVSKRGTC